MLFFWAYLDHQPLVRQIRIWAFFLINNHITSHDKSLLLVITLFLNPELENCTNFSHVISIWIQDNASCWDSTIQDQKPYDRYISFWKKKMINDQKREKMKKKIWKKKRKSKGQVNCSSKDDAICILGCYIKIESLLSLSGYIFVKSLLWFLRFHKLIVPFLSYLTPSLVTTHLQPFLIVHFNSFTWWKKDVIYLQAYGKNLQCFDMRVLWYIYISQTLKSDEWILWGVAGSYAF